MITAYCALAWVAGVLVVRYALTRSAARDQAAAERATRDYFSRVPLPVASAYDEEADE